MQETARSTWTDRHAGGEGGRMEEDDRKWGEGYRERKEGRKEMKENDFEDENAFLQEKSSFNARSTLLLTSLKR